VAQQSDVSVRERRDRKFLFQPPKSSNGIRPWLQSVPHSIQGILVRLSELGNHPEFPKEFVQNHPVQIIELGPRKFALPQFLHRRRITRTPVVGKTGPIDFEALRFAPRFTFFDDRSTPVDNSPESVKHQRLWRL